MSLGGTVKRPGPCGRCEASWFQEKPSGDNHESRTKTDTGGRGE